MKKFLKRMWAFIKLFFVNVDEWIDDHIQPSIELVQKIKAIVDNPVADIVTTLIPGTLDDKIKLWIQENLTKALNVLAITADIADEPTFELKLAKFIEYMRQLSPQMRKAVYLRLTSDVARFSGNSETIKGHSVDLLTQVQYSKFKAQVEADHLVDNDDDDIVRKLYYNPATMRHEEINPVNENGTSIIV